MTHETLTTFFGWMTVLNFGLLTVAALLLMAFRDRFAALHARLFGLGEDAVRMAYFRWLATYKILALVFALTPYLALKLT